MKKIFTNIIITAAMVFAASCTEEHFLPEGSDGSITLRLLTGDLETRATVTETGNVIDGKGIENTVTHADFFFFSDAEGTNLLSHTRLRVAEGGLVADGTNIYKYTFNVSDDGNPLKNTSYVYVIANYPSTIPATVGETKLSDILDLDINVDLSGEFESFVMDSYDSSTGGRLTCLSPSKMHDGQVAPIKEYTIGLTRAAAKLVLNINVKDFFDDAADNHWTPVTNQMWINFVNARKVAKVAAEPVDFDGKANYFTTAQVAPTQVTPALKQGYSTWSPPAVYTYPQKYATSDVTAPYYKIFIPWVCEKKGQNNFYYKIVLPEMESFKRNKIYKLTVDVSVIGGTEDDWALVADNIFVADWWAPEKIESSVEGAMYLDVPVKYYEIYGVDYIDIPVVSSNDIQVTNVSGSKTNLYNGNTVGVTPTISDITKDGFRLTHVLNTNITSNNFDCTPITYTMTVKHTTGGLSKTINVTVVQYPSIWAESDNSNGYRYVNSYTNARNRGGRYESGQTYNSRGNNANGSDQLGNITGGTSSNYNQYVVHVSVLPVGYKVAGMTDDVIIGDPRGGRLANNYLGYYGNGDGGNITRDVQSKYNAVSSSTQNVIAPSIRIASSYGQTSPLLNYDRAEERCAAYQENGYPAGRWRIPTVAEIDFLINLSDYDHIPELFSPSREGARDYDVYWAGGKYAYGGTPYLNDRLNQANHSQSFVNLSGATTTYQDSRDVLRITVNGRYEYFRTYVRCVYDEWYWGSNKYDRNGNEITGTGTAATRWIGYKF